jgi:aminopeptidase N
MNRKFLLVSVLVAMQVVTNAQEQKKPFLKRIFGKKKPATPVWVANNGPFNGEATKYHDLVHTKLDVSFIWATKQLKGKAKLTLKPHFYAQDTLVLDGKGFDIESIKVFSRSETYTPAYTYDKKQIKIKLSKSLTKLDTFSVEIAYTANPENLPKSGSGAITEDKGLYFINPDGSEVDKPKQIWTQGETESSSCWFPTIDHPNQKTTEEVYITVDDKYTTLSNGLLKSSVKNTDGTRTDYWLHDKPHAPYLFMMAIGEFETFKDKWRDIEVNYLMEKTYAPYAKKIFGNTPEMLEFFSNTLGVKYPWDKYSQVVVRDFVSGAMENTSASLFYEGLNVTDRQLLDRSWDGIIAHELFHHWFGDLVTCESWSNLPLNESFANYSEYLWYEHKNGADEADYHLFNEMDDYLDESKTRQEPLIRYHYFDKEDMFDNHSYNKGGCTLHMLRKILGDEAFFASLKNYLTKNAFKTGEISNLRLAFEEVTGQDLHWFFDSFFMRPGHMQLGISHSYEKGKLKLMVAQLQDSLYTPIYKFPVKVSIWSNDKEEIKALQISKASQVFEFAAATKPDLVVFDSDESLLGEQFHTKMVKEYIYQYKNTKAYRSRYKATIALAELSEKDSTAALAMFDVAKDPHYSLREIALAVLNKSKFVKKENFKPLLIDIANNDKTPKLRAYALKLMAPFANDYTELIAKNLNDSAYSVVGGALHTYLHSNAQNKVQTIERFKTEPMLPIIMALSEHFITQKDTAQQPWYDNNIAVLQRREQYYFVGEYVKYYTALGKITAPKVLEALKTVASSKTAFIWAKLAAFNQISGFKHLVDKKATLQAILDKETNSKLKKEYEEVINKIKK